VAVAVAAAVVEGEEEEEEDEGRGWKPVTQMLRRERLNLPLPRGTILCGVWFWGVWWSWCVVDVWCGRGVVDKWCGWCVVSWWCGCVRAGGQNDSGEQRAWYLPFEEGLGQAKEPRSALPHICFD
jgi:hypothetical protein